MKILVEIDTADKRFGELVSKNAEFAPFLFERMVAQPVIAEPTKKKGKRGRPKKLSATGEANGNGEKRKRGRPKKVVDAATPTPPTGAPAA